MTVGAIWINSAIKTVCPEALIFRSIQRCNFASIKFSEKIKK
jgi:hypothetical protein